MSAETSQPEHCIGNERLCCQRLERTQTSAQVTVAAYVFPTLLPSNDQCLKYVTLLLAAIVCHQLNRPPRYPSDGLKATVFVLDVGACEHINSSKMKMDFEDQLHTEHSK